MHDLASAFPKWTAERSTDSATPIPTNPSGRGSKSELIAAKIASIADNLREQGRELPESDRFGLQDRLDKEIVECAACEDRSWVIVARDRVPCSKCATSVPDGAHLIAAGFLPGEKPFTLDSYDPKVQPTLQKEIAAEEALSTVRAWLKRNLPPLLILRGQPGVGKTHLCQGATFELVRRREAVFYITGRDFAGVFGAFDREMKEATRARLVAVRWLVLDDVGAGVADQRGYVALDGYHDVVTKRLRMNVPTLISTNLDNERMAEAVGDRLLSHFAGPQATTVEIHPADDVRRIRGPQ